MQSEAMLEGVFARLLNGARGYFFVSSNKNSPPQEFAADSLFSFWFFFFFHGKKEKEHLSPHTSPQKKKTAETEFLEGEEEFNLCRFATERGKPSQAFCGGVPQNNKKGENKS
jgi:hypothetical protein